MEKNCLHCGKKCEIFALQLGDFFTLTYIRVCNFTCLFSLANEFIYELGEHRAFGQFLKEKENEEDKEACALFIKQMIKNSLETMEKDFKGNPNLLLTPATEGLLKILENSTPFPENSGKTIRFTRTSKEEQIKCHKKYIENLKSRLKDSENELEKVMEHKE